MNVENLKWEVKKRLEEIELRLYWTGSIQRYELIGVFGISPQQGSADLSLYKKLAPGNLSFNKSLKCYESTIDFHPLFISTDFESYIKWSQHQYSTVFSSPSPIRSIEPNLLKNIIYAIHNKVSIEITYQSLSSTRPVKRRISPHAIVYDGFRYHVRAYCYSRKGFRDFLFGRIISIGTYETTHFTREMDESWNTMVVLKLKPHPELSKSQKKIIESDYGMSNGILLFKVRESMLIYVLTQLRIDRFSNQRTAAEQQIVLENTEILDILGLQA